MSHFSAPLLIGGNNFLATAAEWALNATVLEDLGLSNVHTVFLNGFGIGVLEFTNVPLDYNMTTINCTLISSEFVETQTMLYY